MNLCVLWVGCQLSLLGGKKPIATTLCDRRRAIINSCASRETLNPRSASASPRGHEQLPDQDVDGLLCRLELHTRRLALGECS